MDRCEDLNLKHFHDGGDDGDDDAEVNKVDMKRIYIYIYMCVCVYIYIYTYIYVYISHMGALRNVYKIRVGIPPGKKPF